MTAQNSDLQSRRTLVRAFIAIAFIAVVQCLSLARLATEQSDGAHIVDISGAQGMRSQRIALLVTAAHDGRPIPGWRAELERTMSDSAGVWRELLKRPDMLTSPIGKDGRTDLGRAFHAYENAARRIERNPADAAAYAYVLDHRVALLARLDDAVRMRAGRFETYHRWFVGAIFVGLLAQLAGLLVLWLRVFLPTIRRAAVAYARLEESQLQFYSLFAHNPDLIAIYDCDGHIVLGNRATSKLLGTDGRAIGEHFSITVPDAELTAVSAAFDAARSGRAIEFDTAFRTMGGDEIPVRASLFPQYAGDRITGVIGVAKDVRALKAAEANYLEQSNRIAELYTLSAAQELTWGEQIGRTMSAAARRLDFEFAVLSELRGDLLVSIGSIGETGAVIGDPVPLDRTLSRHAFGAGAVWSVDDLRASSYCDEPSCRKLGWGSVVIVPLEIGGIPYGSFVLGSFRPRANPFADGDRHYMSLVASLLASGVQRSQQQRELDALAFFDQLTGLPNRALLNDSLARLLHDSEREHTSFAVHYVDLDLFKTINDTAGHAAGDAVLKMVATRMKASVRAGDVVARVGGDEFVILQRLRHGRGDAETLAKRVVATIREPFVVDGVSHAIGASIGINVCGEIEGEDGLSRIGEASSVLARADEALYVAKRLGRNRYRFAA